MGRSLHGIWLTVAIMVAILSLVRQAEASKYHDPFDPSLSPTAQSVVGHASSGPSVRVLLSGSTSTSMKELADFSNSLAKWFNPASSIDQINPQHFQDDLNRILAANFRSIEYVYSNAAEGHPHVDYILTLEISVSIGKHSFGKNSVDLQGVLSGADRGEKETFVGHGKSQVGFPATKQHFAEARQAAFEEFARNLNASHLLASYSPIPSPTGSQNTQSLMSHSSPQGTDSTIRTGLYEVESKIAFNVLDSVYYDAASGELALIGHHEDRLKDANIPYLQHLATLLESPKPEFSLAWTPDSSRRVDALLVRELTQKESDDQATRLSAGMVDTSGLVTRIGALMLPPLGLYPNPPFLRAGQLTYWARNPRFTFVTVSVDCTALR